MQTKYMKASEAAELWGISLHRVQELCKMGRIDGVTRFGRSWMIPADAKKPEDARHKEKKKAFDDRTPYFLQFQLICAIGTKIELFLYIYIYMCVF